MLLDPWADPRWADEDPRDYLAPKGGRHFNEEGHRIYATVMYEQLIELGMIQEKE